MVLLDNLRLESLSNFFHLLRLDLLLFWKELVLAQKLLQQLIWLLQLRLLVWLELPCGNGCFWFFLLFRRCSHLFLLELGLQGVLDHVFLHNQLFGCFSRTLPRQPWWIIDFLFLLGRPSAWLLTIASTSRRPIVSPGHFLGGSYFVQIESLLADAVDESWTLATWLKPLLFGGRAVVWCSHDSSKSLWSVSIV